MVGALTYSVAGMQAASDRLSIRAHNVANVQTPGFKAAEVVQTSTGSGPVVSVRPAVVQDLSDPATLSGAPDDPLASSQPSPSDQFNLPFGDLPAQEQPLAPSDVSLEYELTDMIMAEHAYKASATAARTVGEIENTLLDIFI
jgi:flagellar hook protein FlgE